MKKVFFIIIIVFLSGLILSGPSNKAMALDLGDILKTMEQAGGGKKKQQGDQKESKEPSRLERRLQLLEGLSTVMSSGQEMDFKTERTIGESLALEGFSRYGLPVNNRPLQRYVNLIGMAVAQNSLRPGLPYRFVVVDNPLKNAFACPGGIIFICSGLIDILENEAQLAGLLAHEVAHVGHKHALKTIQQARFYKGIQKGLGSMKGEKGRQFAEGIQALQTTLFDKGLDQSMEFEADLTAMRTAYKTGYRPSGMVQVLIELKKIQSNSHKKGSWFSTHPPLGENM